MTRLRFTTPWSDGARSLHEDYVDSTDGISPVVAQTLPERRWFQRGWLRGTGRMSRESLLALFGRSAFARNVSIMLFGTVLGQAASVLLAPLLTRLYSPEQFGLLSVFTAFLNISTVLAALRYEIAIASARSEAEAINLTALCGLVLLATTGLLAVLALLVPTDWLVAMRLGVLDHYRWLLPLGFACLGAYFVMLYYGTWQAAFAVIARTRISQGLSGPISQIALGLLGLGAPGLAIGFIIGQSSGTLLLLRRLVLDRSTVLRKLSFPRIRYVMLTHRHYALVSSWAGLIEAMGTNQILYILVTSFYDPRIAGFLFLAERVVARPLQMISTSLLQVFMGEAGRSVRDAPDMLRRRFRQIASRQFLIALAWILLINAAAALWFADLFGDAWRAAVPYLQVMSIAFLGQAVVQAVAHTLQVLNRQGVAAIWQVARMAAVTGGIVICWQLQLSALGTILVYALVQAGASASLLLIMAISIEQVQVRK
jgi:O-antigen/teichoic acid export membrane protein